MHPLPLFRYNWQVRQEWFDRLAELPPEELTRARTGGLGSMLRTLAHIVLVEQAWIRGVLGVPERPLDLDAYPTLDQVRQLSEACRPDVESFLQRWEPGSEANVFESVRNGRTYRFSYGEVVAHLVAHEIHHVGQLSVWAREAGIAPPSANVIFRGLF